MSRRITCDPLNMAVGEQLDLFAAVAEPEPAPAAGPAPAETVTLTNGVPTTVVCLKGRRDDPGIADVLYVGRAMYMGGWTLSGHPLANPYRVGRDGTAEQVVAKYRKWLEEHPRLVERELPALRGRRLGCWCADGAPCHARVLAELADQGAPSGLPSPLEPMSPATVEWVAQHVIADYHLANEQSFGDPDQNWDPQCRCQFPCTWCESGQHQRCREMRSTPWSGEYGPYAPGPETLLRIPAPYRPERRHELYVSVWLADRACRLLCPCPTCAQPEARS